MIKDKIKEKIKEILGSEVDSGSIVIDIPADLSHGDYSSNIAMRLAGQLQKSPMELAETIASKFEDENIEKVEVVKPGFINFWVSKKTLLNLIENPQNNFEKGKKLSGKKIMVEFTDPNPFKEFHIGHLYSNAVGETLSRLLESQGAEVKRANYQGDVGMHVAKALYGIQKQEAGIKSIEESSPKKRAEFLGQSYAQGAKAYEEDENAKKEIEAINKKVYDQSDPELLELYKKGRQWSLDYFETIYKRLGTTFDFYYFESEVGEIGLKLVNEFLGKGVFEQSEGAVIFPGEKHNLHNRVFINSLGLPTYEAKELGLNKKKYEDYLFDTSVIVTGNEINEYFKVLLAAMEKIIPQVASKTKHLGHGMVRLPQGKMSSRTGSIITGEWLLDEAKKKIQEEFKDMKDETAEQVAVGAVKYALLRSAIGRDIAFSFDESISLDGNSGPYLQYTYARTNSVLAKKQEKESKEVQSPKLEKEEEELLRLLFKFAEVVEKAAEEYAPSFLCTYLFSLAQHFNLFYQKHKIVGSEEEAFRLQLTASVGNVLKSGLHLLGIQSPEKM